MKISKKTETLRLDPGQIEVLDDAMVEVLRRKTPTERIQTGFGIFTSVCSMLTSHLKSTHPEWNTERVKQEVAKRISHGVV